MMMIVVDFVSSFKHFSLQTLPFHFSGKKVEISVSQRSLCLGKNHLFLDFHTSRTLLPFNAFQA